MYYNLQVWFNSDLITSILSFSSVAKKYRIVINTVKNEDILLEIEEGKWMRFVKNKLGVYVHNTRKGFSTYKSNNTNSTLSPYSFIHTVSENAEPFRRESI